VQLVPQEVVAAYPRAMLNIHPGFLPTFGGKGFYGSRVHKAVIASGVRFTGTPLPRSNCPEPSQASTNLHSILPAHSKFDADEFSASTKALPFSWTQSMIDVRVYAHLV